jgi:hypothetical protein
MTRSRNAGRARFFGRWGSIPKGVANEFRHRCAKLARSVGKDAVNRPISTEDRRARPHALAPHTGLSGQAGQPSLLAAHLPIARRLG